MKKTPLESNEIVDSIATTDYTDFADFKNKYIIWCRGDFVVEIKAG